jgi:copper(I)-binding protein
VSRALLTAALLATVLGCAAPAPPAGPANGVRVSGAWARPTPPGAKAAAAYFTLESEAADTLVAAAPADTLTSAAELHEMFRDPKGGMGMRALAALELPARTRITLAPGGTHLMLTGLRRALVTGDTLVLRLRFAVAGTQVLRVPVEDDR